MLLGYKFRCLLELIIVVVWIIDNLWRCIYKYVFNLLFILDKYVNKVKDGIVGNVCVCLDIKL